MEAPLEARTSVGWRGKAKVEINPGTEDGVRMLDRIRALEEKARDIVSEISATSPTEFSLNRRSEKPINRDISLYITLLISPV
jgi:hypothetical protein